MIAYVLDKQEVEISEAPVIEGALDHACVEMANGAGRDLFHGNLAAREADCIVVRGKVAHQRGNAVLLAHAGQHAFQKSRFPGPRAGNEADRADSRNTETLSQGARGDIVLVENVPAHFDEPRTHVSTLLAHISRLAHISSAQICSSLPLTTGPGVRQSAHSRHCTDTAPRSPPHRPQSIRIGVSSMSKVDPSRQVHGFISPNPL